MRLFSFSGLFIPHAPVGSVKGMFFLISLASHNNTIQLGLLFFFKSAGGFNYIIVNSFSATKKSLMNSQNSSWQ
jgi:hypothetical protein